MLWWEGKVTPIFLLSGSRFQVKNVENCDPIFSGMESGRVMHAAGLSNAIGHILRFLEKQVGQFHANKNVLYVPVTSQVPVQRAGWAGWCPTIPASCCQRLLLQWSKFHLDAH